MDDAMRRTIAWALLWVAGAVTGAQTADDPDALLDRIKAKARENLTRLPDYICVQTIDRSRKDTPESQFQPVDTIRLEVGLIGDKELFAWPDSSRFQDAEISDLVQRGTIGNGSFALHARNVFLTSGPEFTLRGEETLEDRRVYRFDFDVAASRSGYKLRVPPLEAIVPFHGSFWADAETLDLLRLEVTAEEIPPRLGLAEANDWMEYARVAIGDSDFLLPRSSELHMLSIQGDVRRNRTKFSDCRQYVGEASISFLRAEAELPPAREKKDFTRLPPHLTLELALESEIDSQTAFVGEPVQAVLTSPLKKGEKELAPKGAVVHGRLVRLEKYNQPFDHYVVGLEFHTLEYGGQRAEFTATMRKASGSPALVKEAKTLDPTFDRRRKGFMQILVNEQQSGQGILHWKADKPLIGRGVKMLWETEP